MRLPTVPAYPRRKSGGDDTAKQGEALLAAANDAAGVARNIYITLLAAALFISIVTGSLTDERLLRDSAVPLPAFEKTDLPLSSFYFVAPWMLVFVHAELLMHLV